MNSKWSECVCFQYTEATLLQREAGRPLLTQSSLRSVHDLHAFFATIAATAQSADSFTTDPNESATMDQRAPLSASISKSKSMPDFRSGNSGESNGDKEDEEAKLSSREFIERLVEKDFLEKMASKWTSVATQT